MSKRIVLLTLLLSLFTLKSMATVWYVDSTNTSGYQDGSEWAYAFTSPQVAINTAIAGDSIWIAKGTYPTAAGSSFIMKEGVKIFGGFLNTHTSFAQRNWQNNITILMGAGGGNRVISNVNNGLTANAVLDGFTLVHGQISDTSGIAIFNNQSSPTIRYCNFSDFTPKAIYITNCAPVIRGCTFSNNRASAANLRGGAIYMNNSNSIIDSCVFIGNKAYTAGAQYSDLPGIGGGGGIYVEGASSPKISYCTFTENTSTSVETTEHGVAQGGAIANNSSLPDTIVYCTFNQNAAIAALDPGNNMFNYSYGGAIAKFGLGQVYIGNCSFIQNKVSVTSNNNYSLANGGALSTTTSSTNTYSGFIVVNSSFYGNNSIAQSQSKSAVASGGAIYFGQDYRNAQIINSTFDTNVVISTVANATYYANARGGAIYFSYNNSDSNSNISDCIFRGNKPVTNNSATYLNRFNSFGGAVFMGRYGRISNSQFIGNNAASGGGIYNENAGNIINCFFNGDSARNGGAIYNANGSLTPITNCLVINNIADSFGAGVYNYGSSSKIINCTIVRNRANNGGSAMSNFNSSNTQISNSILWGNHSGVYNDATSTANVRYCLIQGYPGNSANHGISGTTNPLFVDTAGTGNYQLQSTSPCINMGNNDSIPSGVINDLAGAARINNLTVDMGSYEFGNTPLPVSFTTLTGHKQTDKSNLLQWHTFNEDAEDLELQRSANGKTFVTFYKTTTNKEQKYSYTDEQPEGYSYYRVLVKENDGDMVYSNVVFIAGENAAQLFTVYPNPTTDIITINCADATPLHTKATLTDAYGRVMKTVTINSNAQQFSLSGLTQGIYILRMQNGQAVKIVKE